jgi:spore germination protein Q
MYWYDPYGVYVAAPPQQPRQEPNVRKYSEDLLSRNVGKTITVYLTYEKNNERNSRTVHGVLRQVGRDFILITDNQTGRDNMLLNINIDYIEFHNKANLASL